MITLSTTISIFQMEMLNTELRVTEVENRGADI